MQQESTANAAEIGANPDDMSAGTPLADRSPTSDRAAAHGMFAPQLLKPRLRRPSASCRRASSCATR